MPPENIPQPLALIIKMTNELIIILAYPTLTYFLIPRIKNIRFAIIPFVALSLWGIAYAYISTILGLTFENNLIDIISIHLSLFSFLILAAFLISTVSRKESVIYKLSLWIIPIILLICYYNLFGPAETCGQSKADYSERIGKTIKLYHSGFQYGFMDYGSRIIITELNHCGFEKSIGLAENPNLYYGENAQLSLDSKNKSVIIEYLNDSNKRNIDTIFIRNKNN